MMNTTHKISVDRVRRLLEAYYAAETSEADEQAVADFFAKTSVEDLPVELRADAQLLASLAENSMALPPEPAALDALASAAIDRAVGRRRVAPFLWWSAVAAVAATIALLLLPAADVTLPSDVSVVAAELSAVNYMPAETIEEIPQLGVSVPETPKPHTVYRSPRQVAETVESEILADNGAITFEQCTHTEVTDPDRATTIAMRALRPFALLSERVSETEVEDAGDNTSVQGENDLNNCLININEVKPNE